MQRTRALPPRAAAARIAASIRVPTAPPRGRVSSSRARRSRPPGGARPGRRKCDAAERSRELKTIIAAAALAACCPPCLAEAPQAKAAEHLPSIAVKTQAMRHMPGLLALYWDDKGGRLYLEIPHLGADLLYLESL